mgnify:CR=1 FL=1
MASSAATNTVVVTIQLVGVVVDVEEASLVAANTDIRTVADRLGHADAAFTINTYAHSSSESDRAAAAAIEAFQ